MNGKPWTPEEIEWLRANFADSFSRDCAMKLNRSLSSTNRTAAKLGLRKTPEQIARGIASFGVHVTNAGERYRFPKGHPPENKGLRRPGYSVGRGRMQETQFKKGQLSGAAAQNFCPIGTIRWCAKADCRQRYLYIKIGHATHPPYGYPSKEAWKLLHHKLWEEAGNPPVNSRTHALIFKDGDRSNCAIENLELITRAENARRNSIHRLPEEVKGVIRARACLIRSIRRRIGNAEKQAQRSARSSV